ncbi:MAG TPA: hypothetical protein VIO61_04840 [Anaerolineaceae bacterium]
MTWRLFLILIFLLLLPGCSGVHGPVIIPSPEGFQATRNNPAPPTRPSLETPLPPLKNSKTPFPANPPATVPAIPPPLPGQTVNPSQPPSNLHRAENPQIGLNFITFFWNEARNNELNTTTPHYQPQVIFNDFHELGVQVYRQFIKGDLLWNVVEPQDNRWNFTAADAVIKNAEFEPIVTLFALQYASPTPPWEKNSSRFQKTLGPEAKDYLITVVQRYAAYVRYWELGNEMDHWRAADPGSTGARPDQIPAMRPQDGFSPREQGIFLAQAAALIRQYDSDAVIVMPGMSGLDEYVTHTWLAGVIAGGGKDWFDIINYHYYSQWDRYVQPRKQLNQYLIEQGLSGKPVWLTETGSTTLAALRQRTNYPNSSETQAADIFRRIVPAYGHGDALAIWHTYISSPEDGTDNTWALYGIRTDKGIAQPSYYAFKLLSKELIPFQKVEVISDDPKESNVYKIILKNGAVKYVAWGRGTFTVPAGMSQVTSVIPRLDGTFTWEPVQPGKPLILTEKPVVIK